MTSQERRLRLVRSEPEPLPTVQAPTDEFLIAWTEAYLAGYDRGYQVRVAEENGDHSDPHVFAFGRWYNQALEREKADAETARLLAEGRAR